MSRQPSQGRILRVVTGTAIRPMRASLTLAVGLISLLTACASGPFKGPQAASPAPPISLVPGLTPAVGRIPTPNASSPGKLLIGYLSDTSVARGFPIQSLNGQGLDVLIYAFVKISPSGECESENPQADAVAVPQFRELRTLDPGLRIILSIGGYGHSGGFSDAALNDVSRQRFARSCVHYMTSLGLGGIDIDWEFPVEGGLAGNVHRPEDKINLTSLLSELRKELDAQGLADNVRYLLSVAAPAGHSEYSHLELGKIAGSVDWIDVMAYSFRTASSRTTGFDGPLYAPAGEKVVPEANADAAVRAYLSAGVPEGKIVLGMQLYGRGWAGVADIDHGMFQPVSGPTEGTPGLGGVYSYADLATNYIDRFTRFWDPQAKEPWLFDPPSGTMITYEDPQSARAKGEYVVQNHLLGIAVWQLAFDDPRHSLLRALASALHP